MSAGNLDPSNHERELQSCNSGCRGVKFGYVGIMLCFQSFQISGIRLSGLGSRV